MSKCIHSKGKRIAWNFISAMESVDYLNTLLGSHIQNDMLSMGEVVFNQILNFGSSGSMSSRLIH